MSDDKPVRIRRPIPEPETAAAPEPPPEAPPALPATITPQPLPPPRSEFFAACRANLASFGAAQNAIASDVAAMALEIGGLARANLTTAGDSMTALLRATSMTDAVQIQLGFARRSLDAIAGGTTKLCQLGLHAANEAAKPLMARFPAG